MQENLNRYKIEEALNCAKKKHFKYFSLTGKVDKETLGDLAEIALDQGHYQIAIEYAREAFGYILPFHAQRIKFYSILIKAYFHLDQIIEMNKVFKQAEDTLFNYFGPSHPLHVNIHNIVAGLYISKGKISEAEKIFKSSLNCCIQSLGPNHIKTGNLHMEIGYFYLQNENKIEALKNFESALLIFDFYHQQKTKNGRTQLEIVSDEPQVLGDAAIQIASILEEQNRFQEASKIIEVAYNQYKNIYKEHADNTILALWLKVQITFSLSQKNTKVVPIAEQLFDALVKRDKEKSENKKKKQNQKSGQFQEDYLKLPQEEKNKLPLEEKIDENIKKIIEEMDEEMSQIKELCIATLIMEQSRLLENSQKQILEEFCDKIMLEKKEKQQNNDQFNLKELLQYKKSNSTLSIIRKINPEKFPEESRQFLKKQYDKHKDSSFKNYYDQQIQIAIQKQILIKEQNRQLAKNTFKRFLKPISEKVELDLPKVESQEDGQEDETEKFFGQLLDAFYKFNFYQLLQLNDKNKLQESQDLQKSDNRPINNQ